jgi:hypothetical protein
VAITQIKAQRLLTELANSVRRCKEKRSRYRLTGKDSDRQAWLEAEEKMFSLISSFDILNRKGPPHE